MENNTDGKEMAEKLDEFADMIMTGANSHCPDPPGSRIGKRGSLLHALECIAGKSQWIDNTMSDKQLAKYVLCRLYYEKEEAQAKQEVERREKLQQEKDRLSRFHFCERTSGGTPPMTTESKTDADRRCLAGLVLHLVTGKVYDTGKHRWAFGEAIRWDSWNHAPSHFMRGPCPNCGSPTSTYGGGWTCHNDYCPSSACNFACSAGAAPDWWQTQVDVFLDGNAWCATLDDFVNLQESVAGFGETPRDAVENLLENNKSTNAEGNGN